MGLLGFQSNNRKKKIFVYFLFIISFLLLKSSFVYCLYIAQKEWLQQITMFVWKKKFKGLKTLFLIKKIFSIMYFESTFDLRTYFWPFEKHVMYDCCVMLCTIHFSSYVLCTERTKLFWLLTYKGKSCHVYNHYIIFYDSFLFWKIAVFFSKEKYPSL